MRRPHMPLTACRVRCDEAATARWLHRKMCAFAILIGLLCRCRAAGLFPWLEAAPTRKSPPTGSGRERVPK
jgi:hypothetical protein